MRILISARGYDDRKKREIGIFELDQAKALRDAGHDVRIAAIDTRSVRHRRPWGLCEYERDGLRIASCTVPAGPLPFGLDWSAQKLAASAVWRALSADGWRPDVIHAHFGSGLLPTAKKEKIPFVYTEHYSGANRETVPDGEQKRERELYPQVDKLLCVSHPLAENLFRHTGVKAEVIYNIVDTDAFPRPTGEKGQNGVFRFAATGGLIQRKGYDLLLPAMASLREKGYDVSLSVFGDGAEKENLRKLADELGLAERVCFYGNQPRPVIAGVYADMDAFVLPSRLETFGVAYVEAMAAGLPVVATRCGGPEDFVNESNGLLVPVDDAAALTEAMEHLITNRSDYDDVSIAAEMRRRFSPEQIAGKLTEIYEAVRNKRQEIANG